MIHSYCVKPVRAGLFIAMCSTLPHGRSGGLFLFYGSTPLPLLIGSVHTSRDSDRLARKSCQLFSHCSSRAVSMSVRFHIGL